MPPKTKKKKKKKADAPASADEAPKNVALIIQDKKDPPSVFVILGIGKYKGKEYGYWMFPGGRIDSKENPIDAVVRETQEETGYTLTKTDIENIKEFKTSANPKQYKTKLFRLLIDDFADLKINQTFDERTSKDESFDYGVAKMDGDELKVYKLDGIEPIVQYKISGNDIPNENKFRRGKKVEYTR